MNRYGFKVYSECDDDPTVELVEKTLGKIYRDTKNGDYGAITQDRIAYIVFNKVNGRWTYYWGSNHNHSFERIRRITGYLTGTLDRFNNGKKAEEKDRVKHGFDDVNKNIILNRDRHNCSLNDK